MCLLDPFSISISIITSAAVGTFLKAFIDPRIDTARKGREIEGELKAAVEGALLAVRKRYEECFLRSQGPLEERYWERDAVKAELWETITNTQYPEVSPDFDILWAQYCEVYEEPARMKRELFEETMADFWVHFLTRAKEGPQLKGKFFDRIMFQLDDTVYPPEGRHIIAEYCAAVKDDLAKEILERYWPEPLPEDFSRQDVLKEFFQYQPTRMLVRREHGEGGESKQEEEITASSLLEYEKVVMVGDGGVGKTRFMYELEKDLAAQVAARKHALCLPLYVEAKYMPQPTTDDFDHYLQTRLSHTFSKHKYSERKLRGFSRYLRRHGLIVALIDASDQVMDQGKERNIIRFVTNRALLGCCRCVVSTRPIKEEALRSSSSLKKTGGDSKSTFKTIDIMAFDEHDLGRFFGPRYFPVVEPILRRLPYRGDREPSFVHIPMLARLLKIMAVNGEVPGDEADRALTAAHVMMGFVDFIKKWQIKKDGAEDRSAKYTTMLRKIQRLSLKTLGKVKDFDREYAFNEEEALDFLGEDSFEEHWDLMKRIEFIRPFIDLEDETSMQEAQYRFHHQMFQEYFAARELERLYSQPAKGGTAEEWQASMRKLGYMEVVGRFFAELIDLQSRNPENDFAYWQALLVDEQTDDWVRTYALQVRDALGASRAKHTLDALFDQEDRGPRKRCQGTNTIRILGGPFVMGSYEYPGEAPVRWVQVDAFEIQRFPVTNLEFCDFLNACHDPGSKPRDEEGNRVIDLGLTEITTKRGEYAVETGRGRHPVVGVTWFGAQAYCRWRSSEESDVDYGLPTEAEWEKAARGCLGRRYPWGNTFQVKRCNTYEGGRGGTSSVGDYPSGKSPYGCDDMAGNVWEWTSSYYDEDKTRYVLRGGSWFSNAVFARCALRFRNLPVTRYLIIGFRCVRTSK